MPANNKAGTNADLRIYEILALPILPKRLSSFSTGKAEAVTEARAGYISGARGFDALLVGVYENKKLIFVAKVKDGFVPRIRDEIFPALQKLRTAHCPFKNLPEKRASRWGESLTVEKMEGMPLGQTEAGLPVAFVEWTDAGHLRHCTLVAMRDDKKAAEVVRETDIRWVDPSLGV